MTTNTTGPDIITNSEAQNILQNRFGPTDGDGSIVSVSQGKTAAGVKSVLTNGKFDRKLVRLGEELRLKISILWIEARSSDISKLDLLTDGLESRYKAEEAESKGDIYIEGMESELKKLMTGVVLEYGYDFYRTRLAKAYGNTVDVNHTEIADFSLEDCVRCGKILNIDEGVIALWENALKIKKEIVEVSNIPKPSSNE